MWRIFVSSIAVLLAVSGKAQENVALKAGAGRDGVPD
jgi:hypothetical protein